MIRAIMEDTISAGCHPRVSPFAEIDRSNLDLIDLWISAGAGARHRRITGAGRGHGRGRGAAGRGRAC
jgi:hypothetical protein